MVKRVSLFQTADGAYFGTEAEAKAHEATPRKSKPPRWVCRCVCGTYVLRRTKALKPAHHCIESFACTDCINLARIKRNDYVRRTGKEADAQDFL